MAVVACAEAVSLQATNYYALTQMGIAQLKMRDFSAAATSFESAAEIRADHNTLTMLARSQLPNDARSARDTAIRALKMRPDWEEARDVLAQAEAVLAR